MMHAAQILRKNLSHSYDRQFFDDMLSIFTGLGQGEAGKYMYSNLSNSENTNLWESIITSNSDYYVPKADKELFDCARLELKNYLPQELTYFDFGVGGRESFGRYVLPTMQEIGSKHYHGIDFDTDILRQVLNPDRTTRHITVTASCFDFFEPFDHPILTKTPGLGVMNGVTLGNMYGGLKDNRLQTNLVNVLKRLMRLVGNGWLLLSIDTNQNAASLRRMYLTPLNSELNMASLGRMQAQLPVSPFNAKEFAYTPEWLPDQQLFAHLATASTAQRFMMGEYEINIRKGDKIHLFNSYKFRQDFFELCCSKAELLIQKSWRHDTGVILYLLRGH